jgi:hypothetical protein
MTGCRFVPKRSAVTNPKQSGARESRKERSMKWEVRGMRRGRPGRWVLEAPSLEIAQQKAEVAGVTLAQVDSIGQITSAAVALALSPGGRPSRPKRPVGWIAACAACAAVFGAGGFLLGTYFPATAVPQAERAPVPAAASENHPMDDAVAAAAATPGQPHDGPRNKPGASPRPAR